MKKIIIMTLLILSFNNMFSQDVTYFIKNIKVNGVSIPNNGSIEFGNNTSVTVLFTVEFNKPTILDIGPVAHIIGTQSPANFIQLISTEFFTLDGGSGTNGGFSGTWEKVLFASDYYSYGENYLTSKFTQTQGVNGNSPLTYESNRVPIVKSPTFVLSPTSLSLSCGSSASTTFTVTPSNVPTGANVTYQWSTIGWTIVGSSENSRTLVPLSTTSLPSNVSVIPIINGIAKPAISCAITRLSFTSLAFISGSGSLCNTANYTMTGLATGQTVQWSVSNSATVSLTNVTSTSVTVNKIGNGSVVLTATIYNPCGQTTIKTKTITIGPPSFLSNNMAGDSNPLTGETISYSVTPPVSYSTLQWYFDYGGVISTTSNGWQILTGQGTTAITAKAGLPGYVYVVCKATNSCGGSTQYLPVMVRSLTDPCNGGPFSFRIAFKNPIKESENIEATLRPIIDPCDGFVAKMSDENVKKEIQIYDMFGNLIYQNTFQNDFFSINLSTQKIKKGTYFMNVLIDGFEKQQQTIIVE